MTKRNKRFALSYDQELELLADYAEATRAKKPIVSVMKKYKIKNHITLGVILSRLISEDSLELNAAIVKSIKDCLWRYKFARKFARIPKDRSSEALEMVSKLVVEMHVVGFSAKEIQDRIKRSNIFILKTLKEYKNNGVI